MPVRTRDLKRTACDQASRARTEGDRRAAVSRAYYAAYHRCLHWEEGLPHKSAVRALGGTHEQLIRRLGAPDPRCGEDLVHRSLDLSRLLDQQRERRVDADYHLDKTIDASMMDDQIEDTCDLFRRCDR